MKKLLSTLALASLLVSSAAAEDELLASLKFAGGGTSMLSDMTGVLGTDKATAIQTAALGITTVPFSYYAWAELETTALLFIVPNIRVEIDKQVYTGSKTFSATFFGTVFSETVDSSLNLSNVDFIAYWRAPLLGFIPFVKAKLAFGAGFKYFNEANAKITGTLANVNQDFVMGAPYGYVGGRITIPVIDVGVAVEMKTLPWEAIGVNFLEMSYKVDKQLIELPIPLLKISAFVEAGYKTTSALIDGGALIPAYFSLNYSKFFLGAGAKFSL